MFHELDCKDMGSVESPLNKEELRVFVVAVMHSRMASIGIKDI
jgi:hypothetical protein